MKSNPALQITLAEMSMDSIYVLTRRLENDAGCELVGAMGCPQAVWRRYCLLYHKASGAWLPLRPQTTADTVVRLAIETAVRWQCRAPLNGLH